jgi:predicted Zn-dependent protease
LAARIVMLVLAVLACAWFVVGIRQAPGVQRATAIVSESESAAIGHARAREALAALDGAATLNPDTEVQILRARIALEQGDPAGARRILASVVRAEPMNLEAWIWMANASADDRRERAIAFSHVLELVPPRTPAQRG